MKETWRQAWRSAGILAYQPYLVRSSIDVANLVGQGRLVHRDAADALLCRARARLKLGDMAGARDDAAKARSLSGRSAAEGLELELSVKGKRG